MKYHKIWATMLLTAIVAGCDNYQSIVEVPNEREANHIMVTLPKIYQAHKVILRGQRGSTWQVQVPEDMAFDALRILEANNLPRSPQPGIEQALEKSGMIPSQTEERLRSMQALAGEASRALETIPGVNQARVVVSIPDSDLLNPGSRQAAPSVAAVVVTQAKDTATSAPVHVEDVQRLIRAVVAGFPGLPGNADQVRVEVMLAESPAVEIPQKVERPLFASSVVRATVELAALTAAILLILLFGLIYWKSKTPGQTGEADAKGALAGTAA